MHPYDLPGKAQPNAASRSLGGEEGDEDIFYQVGRDAGTVVRHPDKLLILLRIDFHTDLSIRLPFECLHSVLQQVDQDL